MNDTATIYDAWRTHTITGKIIKFYPLGITIDDDRGVRHYATFDRVISNQADPNDLFGPLQDTTRQ